MQAYKWLAVYLDGTTLESRKDGHDNKFSDIDMDKLERFIVYSIFKNRSQEIIISVNPSKREFRFQDVPIVFDDVKVTGKSKLVFFVRRQNVIGTSTPTHGPSNVLFLGFEHDTGIKLFRVGSSGVTIVSDKKSI